MAEDPTIGGHSRWFRLAVLLSVLFVLFASILAVGAVDRPGQPLLGQGGDGDGNFDGLGENVSGENATDAETDQSGEESGTEGNSSGSTDSEGETRENQSEDTDGSQSGGSGTGAGEGGAGSGGFGALNPGESTGVGGETGFDDETFGSNDTTVHFRVESSEPSYWRTGSYDTYTGTGWERPNRVTPYDGSIEHEGPTGQRIDYRVTLEQPATALPTAWRPRTVSGVGDLGVTDDGAVRSGEPLEAGTSFSGVSHRPVRDPGLLRSSGQDYPDDVEQRYTQLPADTPERIGQFTADLTADDESTFDTAVSVQNWLRSSKDYSLEASQRSSHMADTFIFEMEEGYCEYFATSMVAMLRSQDIPSRYVVGYSTGEPVGDNTYEVRGMNAHAWVEVYFEGVGWVQFDPTPSGPRQAAQEDALSQGSGEGGIPGESGEDGESGEGGQSEEPGEGAEDGESGEGAEDGTDGEQTQEDGESEDDGGDSSDGGDSESGEDGTGEDGDGQSQDGDESGTGEDGETSDGESGDENDSESGDSGDSENQDSDGQESEEDEEEDQSEEDDQQQDEDQTEDEEEETIPEPPYEISVSPEPFPGQNVTVTVEKDGTPVEGVEVSFNDDVVGTTDAAGEVAGTVPYANEVIISARPPADDSTSMERLGSAAGGVTPPDGSLYAPVSVQTDTNSSVTYEIPTNVTVESGEVVVPDRTVTANMSLNGSTVSGLDVVVAGETVGTTDESGNFTLPVPADTALGEELSVRFEREDFVAEGNVTVADVEIGIETGLLKLPGRTADVTVTATDGEREVPLEEVPIRTNGGEVVAVSDGNGTAEMTLPWSNEGTATAIVGENTVTASVSGMLLHLLAVLAVPVVVLVGAGVWIRRNPETVRRFKRRAVGALVTAGELLRRIGHRVYTAVLALKRRLLALAGRVRDYFGRLRDGITLALLLSPLRYLIARAKAFAAWILALPGLIRNLLAGDSPEHTQVEGLGSESTADTESAAEDANAEIPAYRRLRKCWRWLVRRVVRRSRTKTAVEVEKRAVEKGLPPRPVRRLRRAFQDVEYGFADPDERVDIAEESVEQLRENTEENEQ